MDIKNKEALTIALHGFLGIPTDFDFLKSNFTNLHSLDYFKLESLSPTATIDWTQWSKNFWNSNFKFSSADKLGKCRLIGYSLGGRLALNAFASNPEKVEKLVLISAGVWPIEDVEREARLQFEERWSKKFQKENWSDVIEEWNSQSIFQGSSFEPQRDEKNYLRLTLSKAIRFWSPTLMPNYLEKMREHQDKILYICGSRDSKYCQKYQELKSKGYIKNLRIIADAGHRVLFDSPEALKREIFNFLS